VAIFLRSQKNSPDTTFTFVSYLGYANQEIAVTTLKNNDLIVALTLAF
jgi:hypothetical protein